MLKSDPDWAPSLHMGLSEGGSRRANEHLRQFLQRDQDQYQNQDQVQRRSSETRPLSRTPTAGGPAARFWREVRPLLLSALQRETVFSETLGPAAGEEENLDFRGFFRGALEASLEASLKASGRRSTTSAPRDPKRPGRKEVPRGAEASCSASSCRNCERLLRRCMELQETLSRLRGGQEDFTTSLLHQDQRSPEKTHHKEQGLVPMLMDQDLSEKFNGPSVSLEVESIAALSDSDLDLDNKRTLEDLEDQEDQEDLEDQEDQASKCKPRQTFRFRKVWLKMFWFLRYSPTLDQMWCHVCRLYAEKFQHKNGMIRGSRLFRVRTIKKHSASNYHQGNEVRHMCQTYNLQGSDCCDRSSTSSST